jgi:FkbM family methyltransferase
LTIGRPRRVSAWSSIGRAIRFPGRSWDRLVRRAQILIAFLHKVDFWSQPHLLLEISEFLRNIEFRAAERRAQPLAIDLGDEALVIYMQNIRRYEYEDRFMARLFQESIRPGDHVLDLGGHHGYYSVIAARQAGTAGKIFVFEPEPNNFRVLVRNIALNGFQDIVTAIEKCVGARRELVTLMVVAEGSRSSSIFLHPQLHAKSQIQVELVTVDEYIIDETIDVIKMDVEGNELEALRGMEKLVGRSPNVKLFAELHPTMLAGRGATVTGYLTQLEQMGFVLQLIDEETGTLRPVDVDELEARVDEIYWHSNLYGVKGA